MSYALAYNPYNTNLFLKRRNTDPATLAFVAAAGITGATEIAAINNLVVGLKKSGLWSKMKAVYPFVTDNRNLLSYTEDFSSGWTIYNLTVTSNVINAPNGTLTADKINENTASGIHLIVQGALWGATQRTATIYAKAAERTKIYIANSSSNQGSFFNLANGTIEGNIGSFTSIIEDIGNGWYRCSATHTAGAASTIAIGIYTTYTGNFITTTEYTGTSGSGIYIWGAQGELGATATTYQPIATTQQAYIASQFKYNLKDPRDLDAAFRLVFNGGWTHSNLGAQANGTNGYADTKLNSFTNLTGTSVHLSYYQRNEANGYQVGCSQLDYSKRFAISPIGSDDYIQIGNSAVNTPKTTTRAYYIGTRNTASVKLYKSNATIITSSNSGILPSINIFLNANNQDSTVNNYSSGQTAFASIGDGLTDDEATNLYYYTQVFQTSLGRQIGSPAYALPAVSDVNAKIYLSAIGSTTNNTFNNAINTFITGLKADGIYSKMKAVYPFATDNINTLSYTEDFSNAFWTLNASSVTANVTTAPNGTTTADRLTENSANNYHTVYVNNYGFVNGFGSFSIYVKFNGRKYIALGANSSTLFNAFAIFDISLGSVVSTSFGTASIENAGNGWYRCTINGTTTNGTTPLSLTLLDDSLNALYTGNGTSGIFLWGAQYELTSTATTYQPQLGSAQTYFANQFKYNMINPQDDDTAFRLVFNGGWTHSPQGATPNGTNGYADTKLVPSSVLGQNSTHFSNYFPNFAAEAACQIGVLSVGNVGALYAFYRLSSTVGAYIRANQSTDTFANSSQIDNSGLRIVSRTASDLTKVYVNNTNNYSSTQVSTDLSVNAISISALNSANTRNNFSALQQSFCSIGDGLTDTEAANLYTRVQNFQVALSRNV